MAIQSPKQIAKKIENIRTKASFDSAPDGEKLSDLMGLVENQFEGRNAPEQLATIINLAADSQYNTAVTADLRANVETLERRIAELQAELSKPAKDPVEAKLSGLIGVVEGLVELAKAKGK